MRPWLNLPTGGHVHMICMGNLGGVFSQENTREGYRERNGDYEWLRITNIFKLYDLAWKVQKSHAVNREGSFNFKYYR